MKTYMSESGEKMNKRGIETRKLIKRKAYVLFAEKGFKEVTMKDICEAAGVSRGGLYCHYDSTRQIFQEIIDDLMCYQDDEFHSKMERGLSAVQILDEVLERYKNEMIDSEASLSVAIYEYFSSQENTLLENDPGENALYQQYLFSYEMWNALIQYGIARDEFNEVEIPAIFDLIIFSYQGVRMYSKLMPIDKAIPERIIREIRKILVFKNG